MVDVTTYIPKVARGSRRHFIRGVDYLVSTWGNPDAPLMVYLHGWADTGSSFQFVVDQLRDDWFVVAPDWRGFGGSATEDPVCWFADYLADLDLLLKHYSPALPVRLVGHSMGGNVAGLYAGAMPERVEAFVNIEGFGLPDSDPATAPARYRAWIEQGYETPDVAEFPDFGVLAKRIRRRSPRMSAAQADFIAREWGAPGIDGKIRLRADPRHKLPNAVLYRRAEAEACWRQATARVLLVGGRDSEFIAANDAILELPFRHLSTHLIGDAGHMLHFEQPAELASAIEGFFSPSVTEVLSD